MRGSTLSSLLLVGLLLVSGVASGCATMPRLEAIDHCMEWANQQVREGTYSHVLGAYVQCMHDIGHAGAVTRTRYRDCGVSGLRCAPTRRY